MRASSRSPAEICRSSCGFITRPTMERVSSMSPEANSSLSAVPEKRSIASGMAAWAPAAGEFIGESMCGLL